MEEILVSRKIEKKQEYFYLLGILIFIFFLFSFSEAVEGATLFLSPSQGSYVLNQMFSVTVYVSSPTQAINAVSGIINFPADNMEVISLSKNDSIVNLWVQEPSYSNTKGNISFEGIILNPGFQGNQGKIITVTFRIRQSGTVSLSITDASVLANDGLGTQLLSKVKDATFTFSPVIEKPPAPEAETPLYPFVLPAPYIKSSTHPDPNRWYQSTRVHCSWNVPKEATAVRILINRHPRSRPTVLYTPPISSKEITDLEEGVWYFHLQLKNKYGWGDITHYRIQIDNTPPERFEIRIDREGDPTNPSPLLIFESEDKVSGVEKYEIKIDQKKAIVVSSEEIKQKGCYKPPPLTPGEHSIIVRAIDYAGNYSLAMTSVDIKPIASPQILDYPKRIYPGENITIAGIVPNCEKCDKIIIYLQNERKEVIRSIAKVEQGKWEDVIEKALNRGVYTATAVAVDNRGAQSLPSKKIKILVSSPVFVKIGNLVIDYLSVLVTCLALIIFMIIVWIYGWKKIKDLKARLQKETTEAEATLYQAFEILRQTVEEQVAKFDKRKGLSKKEREIRDSLWKSLVEARSKIGKEIADINVQLQNKKKYSNKRLIKNKK